MQIKSRELLRQVYVKKKKHQFTKTVIQKNGHQARFLGYVQKICVTNFLEYFVDNVKQPFIFSSSQSPYQTSFELFTVSKLLT